MPVGHTGQMTVRSVDFKYQEPRGRAGGRASGMHLVLFNPSSGLGTADRGGNPRALPRRRSRFPGGDREGDGPVQDGKEPLKTFSQRDGVLIRPGRRVSRTVESSLGRPVWSHRGDLHRRGGRGNGRVFRRWTGQDWDTK